MDKSIIQLVDELPTDNITTKVLGALDFVTPGNWDNLVGFDNTIRTVTGETNPTAIQRIRDRATALYNDPKQGYKGAVQLYQAIDKADTLMATAALANKVGEKISFLSFLGNVTPKPDLVQTIDLILKVAVEIIAFCKINGIPQPNPMEFAKSVGSSYQDAALMRVVSLVCLDGVLPLGPDFLAKIHSFIDSGDSSIVAQNPTFNAISDFVPGNNITDKFGFITQSFNAVQDWMGNLVAKTGVTPQSLFQHLGKFIQLADDHLDFVAVFIDQTTNYFEHTGIQTVARSLITKAYAEVKDELKNAPATTAPSSTGVSGSYAGGQNVEVWDEDDEDWYQATIQKTEDGQYFVHYVGYGSSEDEWVSEDDVRIRDMSQADDNGLAVGVKVKIWDDDEEEWYTATILKAKGKQYFIHYADSDASSDEWVDADEIS